MKNKYVLYCSMVVSLGGVSLCPAASKAARRQDTQAHVSLVTYDALLKSLSLYPTVQEIFKQIHSLPVSGDRSLYRAYVQLIMAEMAEQNMPADVMKAIMQFNKRMVPRSKGSWWKRADVLVPIAASLAVAGIGAWYVWSNRKTKLKGPGAVQRGGSHESEPQYDALTDSNDGRPYTESADVGKDALLRVHGAQGLPLGISASRSRVMNNAGSSSAEGRGPTGAGAGAGSSDAEGAAHSSRDDVLSVVTVEDFNTQLRAFSGGDPAALAYFTHLFTPIETMRGRTVEWSFDHKKLHTIEAAAHGVVGLALKLNNLAVGDIKKREEATKTTDWCGRSTYTRLSADDRVVQAIIDRYVLMYYVVYYMHNAGQGRLIWTNWGKPKQIKKSLAPILTLSQSGAIIDALVKRLKFSAQTVAWGKKALSFIQRFRQTDRLIDQVQKNLQQFCGISDAEAAEMARASKSAE